jgi:radical SAM superfamily enzyme YgiQ (UPF0313 family)
MRIALIIPLNSNRAEESFYDHKFISQFLFSKNYYSYYLAIPTLISLTPPGHQIKVFDENIEEIDYDWRADIVGISARTMSANRAYDISEEFRSRGVKTVLGGIHPSMCLEEALQYCDSVVVGEAEFVWHVLLEDAQRGELKRTYKGETLSDPAKAPVPCWKALSREKYFVDIIQTTKGCPFHCEFCSVHAFDGTRIRNKTVDQVIEEIRQLQSAPTRFKKKSISFADDNIIANKNFAQSLFRALKPYNLNWSCQASINIGEDDETLTLMKESGCGSIFIGFESVSKENLSRMDKGVNLRHDYASAIRKIQSHGILVHSSFIVGYDFETTSSFDELIKFIEDTNLLMPIINILTPFPGTKLFKRLEEEERITHKDWSRYDTKHVVFKPALLSAEELLEGYWKVLRSVYSFDAILRKLNYYWDIDFWKHSNHIDPIKFRYRLLFALRLCTLLFSADLPRSRFIIRILPKVIFDRRVRISTILTLMSYNDYARG